MAKYALMIALMIMGLVSCDKDDMGSKHSILGTWEGKWGFDNDTPTYFEKWDIRKNGGLTAYSKNGVVLAEGSWEVDGLSFEAVYTPTGKNYTYSFSGLYHDALKEIIGTWGDTPSSSDRGTFEMYKK